MDSGMIKPYWQAEGVTLYHGDCLEVLAQLEPQSVDAVITDPPFPEHERDYPFTAIDFLAQYFCRQFIFWGPREPFPLDFTGKHVWDKVNGIGCQYEYIYERNGSTAFRVFRHISPTSSVRAQVGGDTKNGHPDQKPIKLLLELVEKYTSTGVIVADFFMGSGTTGVACAKTGRRFIGIEIDEGYCEIARQRIEEAMLQPRMI